MKNTLSFLTVVFAFSLFGSEPSFVEHNGNGKSYIDVSEYTKSFKFTVNDYSSQSLAGRFGYFTYFGKANKKNINNGLLNKVAIEKDQSLVEINNLEAGTKIGFYLTDPSGNINTAFNFTKDPELQNILIEFEGNGNNHGHNVPGKGYGFGNMGSGWMAIGVAKESLPTGRPLPGFLSTFLFTVVSIVFLTLKFKHKC